MAREVDFQVDELTLKGVTQKIGTPNVLVLVRRYDGLPLICMGATVPTNNDIGYAPGCLFISTAGGLYVNVGTAALANFDSTI